MASDEPLRVMTLNLHNAKDAWGQDNVQRLTDLLSKHAPDIVGLQEVQPIQLKRLDIPMYRWAAGPNANLITFRFGNAVLVRGNIVYYRHHYLPGQLEQRGLDEVGVEVKGRQFVVFNTHLGLGKNEREQQMEFIQKLIEATPYPKILLGDFNTPPTDPIFKDIRHAMQTVNSGSVHLTYPAAAPRHELDQIWASDEFRSEDSRSILWEGSDHLPVLAELILDSTASQPIAAPPEIQPELQSSSSYRAAHSNAVRLGVTFEPDGEDTLDGRISIPIGEHPFIHANYNRDTFIASLGWALDTFDLRDYMSLAQIHGTGQWNVLASWSEGYDPWLVWEQNYQWSPRWITRIDIQTGGPKAAWELQQTYVFTDKASGYVALDGDERVTIGLNLSPNSHQRWTIAYLNQGDRDQWQLTLNVQ